MSVDVQNADLAPGLPGERQVRDWVEATLAQHATAPQRHGPVCVRYVDASEARALNLEFRGQDKPTNVLSFPADIPQVMRQALATEALPLGDLVLCVPVLAQQAAEQGKTLTHHTAHLVVHGVLHLLGQDHQEDAAAAAMESAEISILAGLGIGNPYADDLVVNDSLTLVAASGCTS